MFFLSHKTRKYKIYLSSLFPFIISVKFGLPLTNPISVGIRASSFVFGLLKFSCYSRIDCSSSSWILYFLVRFLCSFHICLERSIFLVCNQKKKKKADLDFEFSIVRYLQFTEQMSSCQKVTNLHNLFEMNPRQLRSVQFELVEMRQLCEALHQRMDKVLH